MSEAELQAEIDALARLKKKDEAQVRRMFLTYLNKIVEDAANEGET